MVKKNSVFHVSGGRRAMAMVDMRYWFRSGCLGIQVKQLSVLRETGKLEDRSQGRRAIARR